MLAPDRWGAYQRKGFPSGLAVKNLPAMQVIQETHVQSLGQEDPLEKGVATHSSVLAWRIQGTEELGRLHSIGLQRVRHDWATKKVEIGDWSDLACTYQRNDFSEPWVLQLSIHRKALNSLTWNTCDLFFFFLLMFWLPALCYKMSI